MNAVKGKDGIEAVDQLPQGRRIKLSYIKSRWIDSIEDQINKKKIHKKDST